MSPASFFRRFGPLQFDQADIRAEAAAFSAFVEQAVEAYRLLPEKTDFLGYSNGANLLAAAIELNPGVVRRAVLLRPMPVLDAVSGGDLAGTAVLIVAGNDDPYREHAERLADRLDAAGAAVTFARVACRSRSLGGRRGLAREFLR